MSLATRVAVTAAAVAAAACARCGTPEGGATDAGGDGGPEGRLFSFAILTDIHVGEGYDDYGTPGFDDSGGDEYEVTETARAAVDAVNRAVEDYDIAFVAVLGDMSGSAETSELARCREVLDELDVPYFPLIGNHDVWPYTATDEAEAATGDRSFEAVFGDAIEDAGTHFDGFVRAPGPVPNPERGGSSLFINYAFDHLGRRFLALDLNTRMHAGEGEPGIGPEADLHDFDGGTLPWLREQLARSASLGPGGVIAFAHHPPMVAVPIQFGLSEDEHDLLDAAIRESGAAESFFGFFGGHHHVAYELEDYASQQIVVLAATKDGDPPRVVQLFADGRVDFATSL